MNRRLTVLAFAFAGLLASCSGSAPSVDEWKWRIIYRDDGEHRYEELYGVFRASDPDGAVDFAALTVSADSASLEWSFDRDSWMQSPSDETLWGLPPMIPHEGMRLPDGLYTVVLSDLAGRTAETTFRPLPDRPHPAEIAWPEVSLEEGRLSISGPYPAGELILWGEGKAFLGRVAVTDGVVPDFGEAVWWELWFGYENPLVGESTGLARTAALSRSWPGGDEPRGFRLGPFPVRTNRREEAASSDPISASASS